MTEDINKVMEAHAAELMAMPGVNGVAVGETEEGTPCILVLASNTEGVYPDIPVMLEGHPVRIFESGEIRPM